MRLSVLTKYLIRAHLGPFAFALCTITSLIFLNAVAQRVNDLFGKGLPLSVVRDFLILSLPHTIALSLPMAVLVAVLYAFSEMTSSNEITAMSAGGVHPLRVIAPLLVMGTMATGVMLYFNDRILPESNHALKNLLVDIGRKSPTLELREQVVNEIRTNDGSGRYFLTAARIDPITNVLEDVTIFQGNEGRRQRTTYAERGEMAFSASRTDLFLTLYEGVVHEVQFDQVGGFQRVFFEEQIVPLRDVGNELERRMGGSDRSDREMGFGLLAKNVRDRTARLDSLRLASLEQARSAVRSALALPDSAGAGDATGSRARPGASPVTAGVLAADRTTQRLVMDARSRASQAQGLAQSVNRFEVEIHKKIAIAVACLIFTLIGPPLALRFPRGGVGMVVAASTVIFSIYWVGLIGGESLADRQVVDPAVSMWLSNGLFLVAGIVLALKMGNAGSTVRGSDGRLLRLWTRLTNRLRGSGQTRRARAAG